MQKWVLQNRNHWMVMTGIFILISFGLKMLSMPGKISTYFLIGASLIGGLPIAIQAVQTLSVKVIIGDSCESGGLWGFVPLKNQPLFCFCSCLVLIWNRKRWQKHAQPFRG